MAMNYKYVRIQGKELAENTMYAKGVFSMCWQLIQNDAMEEEDADLYREIDKWFAEVLPFPDPCRRQESVVCWFKTENADEMMKMIRPALWLLEKYNHPYYLVYTNTLIGSSMRGMGVPQVCFAMESQLDRLAKKLSITPEEIRRINLFEEYGRMPNGQISFSAGARKSYERAWEIFRDETRWRPEP